jgi:hypothetical protein
MSAVKTGPLAGMTEIAEHFDVRTNVVSNWISRYPDFPEPVLDLAMGRVWDLDAVVEWYNDRWARHA